MSLLDSIDAMTEEKDRTMEVMDVYTIAASSIVSVKCKNKGLEVYGITMDPVSFTVDSKWDNKALGSIASASVTRIAENVSQLVNGVSINQPILARSSWGGTLPLEMSAKFSLIATNNGRNDVYVPALKLAAMLQPRLVGSVNSNLEGVLSLFAIPGPAPFGGEIAKGIKDVLKIDIDGDGGDPVSVQIGNVVELQRCYLTKLNVIFSRTYGTDGFPVSAEVTINFRSIDSPYVVPDADSKTISIGVNKNNILKASNSVDETEIGGGLARMLKDAPGAVGKFLQDGFEKLTEAVKVAPMNQGTTTPSQGLIKLPPPDKPLTGFETQ